MSAYARFYTDLTRLPTFWQFSHHQLIQSRSAVRNLESLLKETKEELDKTVAALRLTQKQADRRRSESVRKLNKNADLEPDTKEDKSKLSLKPASNAASTAPSPAAGSPGLASPVKHEVKEEQEQNELRDVLEGSSGLTRSEIEALQQEAESRQKQVDALNQENLSLRHQLGNAKIDSRSLSDEVIKETALYRRLLVDLEEYRTVAEAAQAIQKELREELLSLRGKETQHRQDLEQEYAKEATKLNKDLTRLQSDLVRVRHERDKGIAEIAELSSKDAEKCRHVEEMKTLAHSRQMRINTLVSEVYRLRMALAAEHGDAELLQTYSETWKRLQSEMNGDLVTSKEGDSMSNDQNPLPEEALVKSLQSRVKELEALAVTYREQLQTLSGAADEDLDMAEQLVRGEAQAKADLEEAQAKITKLEGMLGESGAPDVATLAKRTTDAEKMVTTLEAKVKAHDLVSQLPESQ